MDNKVIKCPCCGGNIDSLPVEAVKELGFTKSQLVIVELLQNAFPKGIPMQRFVDRLYSLDPNGGADDPKGVVRVHIYHIRKILKGVGWRISKIKYGYQLEKAHAA